MSDPPEELPSELRDLVGAMRRDALEPPRVARVAQGLGPILDPSGGGGGPSGSGGGGGLAKLGALGKIAASTLVLGSVAALAISSHAGRSSAPPHRTVAVAPTPPVAIAPAAIAAASSAPETPAAPVLVPPAPTPNRAARGAVRPSAAASGSAGADDVMTEEALLLRARAAEATSPQKALALADEHAKRFPHGVLLQEREVLAIDALGRLGRTEEASARAHRFAMQWPTSPYVREFRDRGLIE